MYAVLAGVWRDQSRPAASVVPTSVELGAELQLQFSSSHIVEEYSHPEEHCRMCGCEGDGLYPALVATTHQVTCHNRTSPPCQVEHMQLSHSAAGTS